jgi:Domain of unknown function (DUF222)
MGTEILDGLREALDALADVDVEALSDGELHAVVVELAALSTRLEAQWCRTIARWDARMVWAHNGSRSPAARLSRDTGRRQAACGRLVTRARKLVSMPATAVAYRTGEICGDHVDLVGECNRDWPDADFADAETLLVDACRTLWFADAVKAIEYWKQHANPDGADADAEWLREGRTASIATGWNGDVHLDVVFDPLGGETFRTALAAIEHQLLDSDRRDATTTRTARQRRVDALVEMATRAAAAPPDGLRPRPLLTVLIGDDALQRTCETAHGTVIAPGAIVPLLSDAEFERVVYDPPNRRIEVSHRRRFTGALRRVIEVRDRHCQHPAGCDVPAADCDIDHIRPYSLGGVTSLDNGRLLCATHNRITNNHGPRPRPNSRPGVPLPAQPERHPPWTVSETDVLDGGNVRAPPESAQRQAS